MAAGTFFTYVQSTNEMEAPFFARPCQGLIRLKIVEGRDGIYVVVYFDDKDTLFKMLYKVSGLMGVAGIGFACAFVEMICFRFDFELKRFTPLAVQNFFHLQNFHRVDVEELV